jgi:peptidoglycan/LPS O-acetylase OafA/YrhL
LLQTSKYIKGLDSLRAISIGFVLLNHLGVDILFFENQYLNNNLFSLFSGETGVHIFFVLSGFLITKILWAQFESTGKIALRQFFIRRFLRLAPPLIIFYLLVFLLMMSKIIVYDLEGILFAFFYLYNYVPLLHYRNELAHIWSLSVEEQFYLIWPFFILLIRKYKMLLILISIFILFSIIATIFLPEFVFKAHLRPKRWFLPAGGFIAIGVFIAIIQAKNNERLLQLFHKQRFPLVIFACCYLSTLLGPIYLIEVFSFLQAIGFGILILWIFHNQKSKLVGWMEMKPIVYLGKISYGIYVFQGLFLLTGPGSELKFQQFPLNIIFTLGLAVLSYHLFEKPILRYKNQF